MENVGYDGPILQARNLEKYFDQNTSLVDTLLRREKPNVEAVDGVNFAIERSDSLAVIGESGCGKTTLLMTLMGLHDHTGGEIQFKGKPFKKFTQSEWKDYRRSVQVIFQDPFNSLDPKYTIEETLKEPLKIHGMDNKDRRVRDILDDVELQPAEKYLDRYPANLSGGEKQRVSIARALILEPDIILADEPVSMLDVSTQASVLNMLKDLVNEKDVGLIYISHDLSTVSYITERVNVMYLGRFVEKAPTEELLSDPKHPYSQALINAIPIPDPTVDRTRTEMSGAPQDPIGLGEGCRFRDRCPERMDICEVTPETREVEDGHHTACHLHYDHEEMTGESAATESAPERPANSDDD